MDCYKAFLALGLDLGPLGLEVGPAQSEYDCTPPGAQVLGWAGVDGIHYCFAPGFGETVFAVSPMEPPGEQVHPVARSFEDFLRLLLACGGAAALDQAHGWTQAQFDRYCAENRPNAAQAALLEQLERGLSLAPMEQPFSYIKTLQAALPFGRPSRGPQEQPALPENAPWRVSFHGNLWSCRGRAGQELPLGRTFVWGQTLWHIPSAYLCGAGLVLDFCIEVEPERIQAHLEKWGLPELSGGSLSSALREQQEAENPLELDFTPVLTLNGKILRPKHGFGLSWLPDSCRPAGESNDPAAAACLAHYRLDPQRGWIIRRFSFPWATQRKPRLRSLRLCLSRQRIPLPGPHFVTPPAGQTVSFSHPVTGAVHTLTVLSCEPQTFSPSAFAQAPAAPFSVPPHYVRMTYALAPDLPDRELFVCDCAESDPPALPPSVSAGEPGPIGLIGGSDGPTALFLTDRPCPGSHIACSSLHFQPAGTVEWRVVFRHKPQPDIQVTLME